MSHPVRPCVACLVFDDHPRHVVADPANPGNEELMHMDCCRDARDCGICAAVLAGVEHQPSIVGDELRALLVEQAPTLVEHVDGSAFGAVNVQSALI